MKLTLMLLLSGIAMAQLPDEPRPQHRALLTVMALDWAATVIDAKSSVTVQSFGTCVESDPLFGRNPSPGRYWSQMILTTGAIQLIGWQLRRHRIAYAFAAVDLGEHLTGIGMNYRNCRR